MGSTTTTTSDDFALLSAYHHTNINSQHRTPSPSSSSTSSNMDEGIDINVDSNLDQWLLSAPTDFNSHLEMDSFFPDAEALDTFCELQREEQRLREELIYTSSDININRLLQEGDNSSSSSSFETDNISHIPFDIEFNSSESLSNSNSPESMFMIQNEHHSSTSSNASTSSLDVDLNFDKFSSSHNHPASCASSNGDDSSSGVNTTTSTITFLDNTFTLSPSTSCRDSPPLSPAEFKVDIIHPQILFPVGNNTSNIVSSGINILGNNFPAQSSPSSVEIISTFKPNNKRGRSASNDDTPDVQALKRHIRMIRNRESASLSRKKKKEYLTGLEDTIKDLQKENDVLKKENQFLKSKLQSSGIKLGLSSSSPSLPSSSNSKRKTKVGVVAKLALLGLFGFVMINFTTNNRSQHHAPIEHSNLSEFSRTMTKLKLSEDAENNVPLLSVHHSRFIPRRNDDEDNNIHLNYTRSNLALADIEETQHQQHGSLTNITSSSSITTTIKTKEISNSTQYFNNTTKTTNAATPTSYLNGTSYNQSTTQIHLGNFESSSSASNASIKRQQRDNNSRSRWRSSRAKKNMMNGGGWSMSSSTSSLKSANLVFPPFIGSVGMTNSSTTEQDHNNKTPVRCANYFNKTESMRVKSDLEDIFGKGRKLSQKKMGKLNLSSVRKREPIVYSLISHNDAPAAVVPLPRKESLNVNNGLAVYDGDKKKFSTILDKLVERREDTFYVVSDNQLLLSAKASNESSRPKMTLLLQLRNETLNEDVILQIDCEVFQVFNLNEKKQQPNPQKQQRT